MRGFRFLLSWLPRVTLLAILYALTGWLGFSVAVPPGNVTAVWFPSGLSLAALLRYGDSLWPGVWIGSYAVNSWFMHQTAGAGTSTLLVPALIATGSTLQTLLGAALVRRAIGSSRPFDKVPHVFLFALIQTLACTVAPTIGVTALTLFKLIPWEAFAFTWGVWWLGDFIGILLVSPPCLVWEGAAHRPGLTGRYLEFGILLGGLFAVSSIIFNSPVGHAHHPLAYGLIPLLLWIGFRFGQRGVMSGMLIVAAVAMWGTFKGAGPFARPNLQEALWVLQAYLGIVTLTTMTMAAGLKERRTAEEALEQWRHVFLHAGWPVALAEPEKNTLIAVNAAFARTHGYTVDELIGKPLADMFARESRGELAEIVRLANEKGDHVYESIHLRKDGSTFPVLTHVSTYKDGRGRVLFGAGTFQDITERKQFEKELRESEQGLKLSLAEKELLLKEIHHRVKNNLQVISSLLSLQSNYISDPKALAMFQESQNRVRSMALVHEKLYRAPNVARINMADYLKSLTHDLQSSHVGSGSVTMHIDANGISLGIDTAIPCALLVNELIANALEHAFAPGTSGEVWVRLKNAGDNKLRLEVSDDGKGFPKELDFRHTETLGMNLVVSLVEQLRGTIALGPGLGASFQIVFPS